MRRHQILILAWLLAMSLGAVRGQTTDVSLAQRPWVEIRTAHFHFYSCGALGSLYKLAARLEQFCTAYSQLAGTQALESPPIVVMAFPDQESMKPFLPQHHGHPANLSGFFLHGHDENLIVLSLPPPEAPYMDLEVIFHEYGHFLFRHNDRVWPLWLKEGMAEIYSTFAISGRSACIAVPIDRHLQTLATQPLLPLADLFAVKEDSPQYNERERQGLFYAESWLLTHFLMTGDHPEYTARFGQFTTLLHQGMLPLPAFTNALQAPLPRVQADLQRYLARRTFRSVALTLGTNISAPVPSQLQRVVPAEVYFRLGDELLRVQQLENAESFFVQGRKLAPKSPWLAEGLGLLASQRDQPAEALRYFKAAIDLGSTSFLTYYEYAQEEYSATADSQKRHTRLPDPQADEIRRGLLQSITLMPDFASAHALLGFFEMVQGDHLEVAQEQLLRAIQLEPENHSYLLSLAQLQMRTQNPAAARQTLQPLLRPNEAEEIRTQAQAMLNHLAGND